jgi:hypothetical protein
LSNINRKNYYIFDAETTGLATGSAGYFHNKVTRQPEMLSHSELRMQYGHLSMTQWAFTKTNMYGRQSTRSRTMVFNADRPFDRLMNPGSHTRTVNTINGPVVSEESYGRTIDRDKLVEALLQGDEDKVSKRQVEHYVDTIGAEYIKKSGQKLSKTNINGKEYISSVFSRDYLLAEGEDAPLGVDTLLNRKIREVANQARIHISHDRVSREEGMNAFANELERILTKAEKTGLPATIGGVNISFDHNVIKSELLMSNRLDLLNRVENAQRSGLLIFDNIEERFKRLAYKMYKADPRFLDAEGRLTKQFLIRDHPGAVADVGLNRIGKRIATEEEFLSSTFSAKAQNIFNFFGDTPEMQKVLPGGKEFHGAPLDTSPEGMSNMKMFLMEDLIEAGVNPIEAAEQVGVKRVGDKLWDMAAGSERIAKWQKGRTRAKNPVKGVRSKGLIGGFTEALNALQDVSKSKSGLKSKAKIGLALAALVATYGFTRSETKDSLDDRIKRKLGAIIGFFRNQPESVRIQKHADRKRQAVKTWALSALIPAAALWTVGFIEASERPSLLGVRARPSTVEESVKNIFRTIAYGIKKVESIQPLTRVFRLSSVIGYLKGTRRLGEYSPGKFKGVNIATIKDGQILDRFSHSKIGKRTSGIAYEDFLDAVRTTENSQYSIIKGALEPTEEVAASFEKLITKISVDHKGRAIVFFDTILGKNEKGETIAEDLLEGIAKDIHRLSKTKQPITVEAMISYTGLRSKDVMDRHAKGVLTNAIQFFKTQKDLYQRGYSDKVAYEKFLQQAPKSANQIIASASEFTRMARYYLDVASKGIGESNNTLFEGMQKMLQQTKGSINVKTLVGKYFWSGKNAEVVSRSLGPIFQELSVGAMNHFLERPFEFLGLEKETIVKLYNRAAKMKTSENFFAASAGKLLSNITGPHLGLANYTIKGGIAGYLGKFTVKRILPVALAIEGVRFVDHVLGNATGSPRGPILSAPVRAWQGLQYLYSGASDLLGLTSYAKKQENYAPGSTGPGFFALGATMATTFKVAETLYKYAPTSSKNALQALLHSTGTSSYYQPYLRKQTLNGLVKNTAKENIIRSFLSKPKSSLFMLGLLPMLPFLPGLLGSNKSLAERRAEYRGEKEVPIRQSRGWILSSSPLQGGKTIQYRRSAINLMMADWENRGVIWPSYYKRFAHNATAGLYGRYMLENFHQEDQPVYQSGAYGANTPLIGPLLEMSGIGRLIKPTVQYHGFKEKEQSILGPIQGEFSTTAFSTEGAYSKAAKMNQYLTSDELAHNIGLSSLSSNAALYNRFTKGFHDFIGFRGFFYESMRGSITGQKEPDEFVPYAENATEMYNTSQQMWQYNAGDVSIVGGELLRRIFMYPEKKWKVNTIPNELAGVSWIPQTDTDTGKKSARDLTKGTTFDKVPMGWLYADRKGWEFLFPTMKGVELEDYGDPVKVEILKHIAPYSGEFKAASSVAINQAIQNRLDPFQEQRLYESISQAQEMRQQLNASSSEYSYAVQTEQMSGRISSVDEEGKFTIEGMNKVFQLAGVSTEEADIRSNLIGKRHYEDSKQLSQDMNDIIERTRSTITNNISVGENIQFSMAQANQLDKNNEVTEVIVGNLNQKLLSQGAAYKNTGLLANYNMRQKMTGYPSQLLSKYWNKLTAGESFWMHKLVNKKDYLSTYKYANVFNREVKLWQHPIEQILKPMIASTLHKFGSETIPSFTIERRRNQEYWDAIKYIKYRMLEKKTGNPLYKQLWKSTMLGANPYEDDMSTIIQALPENERTYFDKFVSEPDPKKRGEILKYLPRASRRIYMSLWEKQQHRNQIAKDPKEQEYYNMLQETEGFGMTEGEEEDYNSETGGSISKGDWKRMQYIKELAKTNPIPGVDDEIFSEQSNLENVEMLSLRDQGENLEDYGFFEDKIRVAAFDARANLTAIRLNSQAFNSTNIGKNLEPWLSDPDNTDSRQVPTQSINPMMLIHQKSNGYERLQQRNLKRYIYEIGDDMLVFAMRRL